MKLTPCRIIVGLVLMALAVGSCSTPMNTAPSPATKTNVATPVSPTVPVVPGYDQKWSLTTVVTRVDGSSCVAGTAVAATATGSMLASRSDQSG